MRSRRFWTIRIILLSLSALIFTYCYLRLESWLLVIPFVILLLPPLFAWGRKEPPMWSSWIKPISYFSMNYVGDLFFLLLMRDITLIFGWGFLFSPTANVIMLLVPLLTIGSGYLVTLRGPQLKKVSVKADLPRLRLLQISDLHLGDLIHEKFVKKLLKLTNELQVDAVLWTGDITDSSPEDYLKSLSMASKIRSRFGNYWIPGNHEYFWNFEITRGHFYQLGFKVLVNSTEFIEVEGKKISVSGVSDFMAASCGQEAPDFQKVASEAIAADYKILLCHQPKEVDLAVKLGFNLQLSGHTHGGQYFPWNFVIHLFQKYVKGYYRVGTMDLYVNQGTGFWGPANRLGTFCEVTLLEIGR